MKTQNTDDKWVLLGKYLGYPSCCIESFETTKGAFGNPRGAQAGKLNGVSTGFIPCPECAEKVLSGKIKLEELIKDRVHSEPFPMVNHRKVTIDV